MTKKVFAFVSLTASIMIFSQEINSARFENIVNTLKLKKEKIKTELYTEKKMPNEESLYIVVPVSSGDEDDGIYTVQNYILITDEKGNIKSRYPDFEEIVSEDIGLGGITIDTGVYTVNENIRAFGVRMSFSSRSHVNPYAREEISLFYPQKGILKKILNRFEIYSYSG